MEVAETLPSSCNITLPYSSTITANETEPVQESNNHNELTVSQIPSLSKKLCFRHHILFVDLQLFWQRACIFFFTVKNYWIIWMMRIRKWLSQDPKNLLIRYDENLQNDLNWLFSVTWRLFRECFPILLWPSKCWSCFQSTDLYLCKMYRFYSSWSNST